MTTTTIPDVMVCYQCGKRIYRKAGAAVIHLFWNRRPGERTIDPSLSEPGWAHVTCAERAGVYGMQRHYQYPWGEPDPEPEPDREQEARAEWVDAIVNGVPLDHDEDDSEDDGQDEEA